MRSGVTIVDPESTYIDSTVKVGQDTVIYPFSFIERGTVIGKNCVIGPHVKLSGAKIGNNVSVQFSVVVDTQIKSNTDIEPYSYIVNGEEKNRKG